MPSPVALGASGPDESTETRLARVIGSVVSKPSRATSGDIAFDLEISGGAKMRIFADGSSGLGVTSVSLGSTYELIGIAGQRASRKGAPDGYRLWLRDAADIATMADAPPPSGSAPPARPGNGPRPTAAPAPGGSPTPSPSVALTIVPIAQALTRTDRDIRIEAVVTAGATLLDASGRRLVVQDASGAIEVLVAADIAAPPVGTRLRLTGRVGVAYGAPRLRASILEHIGSGALPPPLEVRGPLTDGHTWRLVTISGRVEDMKKLGDRWRAEITIGAQRIVIVGQPGAGIEMARLPEGATATIIGIVRRAYANASDQRPSLLPRSSTDIRLTSSATGGGAGATGRGATTSAGAASASGAAAGPVSTRRSPGPGLAASAVVDADLRDLANVAGQKVRVGGLVTALTDVGFTLDDGTSLGAIVLMGSALDFRSLIEPGDAINVTGRVDRQDDATYAVTVEDGAAIVLGDDLGDHPSVSPVPPVAPSAAAPADVRAARLGDGFGTLPATGAGVASALLIALASLAVTLLRRRHARRLLASRIAARLAVFAGAPAATADGQAPERGVSVGHAR